MIAKSEEKLREISFEVVKEMHKTIIKKIFIIELVQQEIM
jgi:hypothetical protein